jgi:nucleoid-associated protein YgaU
MSNPSPNSNPNLAAQAAAQAAQAAIQAAKANAQNAVADDNEESSPAETDEQLAKAWGFSGKRPKLSREAVIGLVAIVALLGLFSYVVVRYLKNRATVAAKPDIVDSEVTPASNSDLLDKPQSVVGTELDELEKKPSKPKSRSFDDDDFGIGDGQKEPTETNVVTKRPSVSTSLDDEFGELEEDTKTTNLRTQPKATASANDMPDFGDEDPPAKPTRVPATLDLGIETQSEPDDSALTKTTEPIRLKQPAQPTAPADEDFEEPVRVGATNRPEPKDDFEPVPQRAQPTRVAQKDMFAEATGFDDPKAQTSPTTDLPPARQETAIKKEAPIKKSSRHPLLREGEYLVAEGDNFCVISKKLYGSEKYYLALAEHNRSRVADPCRMRPGLIIAAPAKEVLEQQHATLIPKPKPTAEAKGEKPHAAKKVSAAPLPPGMFYDDKGSPWYRVGKGDTLTGIAQAHLGRVSRASQIANLNRERLPDPNDLRLGQELRLPNDASQVRLVDTEKTLR